MAFNAVNFAAGNTAALAPGIHTYTTTDATATIDTSGYFNSISKFLRVGDLIYVYTSTGGTAQGFFYTVRSNAGGVVDVNDGIGIGTTNTD